MSKKWFSHSCWRSIVVALMASCTIGFLSLNRARADIESLFGPDNPYYCPASQHSCSFGTAMPGGVVPFPAPDQFDVGALCDRRFLNVVAGPNGLAIDQHSCYGACDHTYATTGTVPLECYANCQGGTDGMSGYAGCLRGAFGIGPKPTPVGNGDPRDTPSLAGNIYRNCLVGIIPAPHQPAYDTCIASGRSLEDCCTEVANNFP
jgi:hypothetical protein